MTTPVPGTRIICTTCGGDRAIREPKRAQMRADPEVYAMNSFRRCPACEGTGWLPPLHLPADPEGSDGDEVDN